MIFFAIPFFKNTKYLEDTLLSLISQTSPSWAAVVLDDSTETEESKKAKECVDRISDPRIEYRKNVQNLGMANNWNQGLDLGKKHPGSIATTILHADDRLLPHYVSVMLTEVRKNPMTIAFFCRAVVIDENGKRTFSFTDFYKNLLLPKKINGKILLSGIQGIKHLIPGNFIFCPTLCYNHELLKRRFNPDLKMVTDFELTLDLLLHGHQFMGIYSFPLFEYRRHSSNTTNLLNQNLTRFKEERDLYLNLAYELDKKGCFKLANQARELKIIKKNLLFQIVTSFLRARFTLMNRYFQFYIRLHSFKSH